MLFPTKLTDYKSVKSLGYKLRKRRSWIIRQLIEECGVAEKSILDVGGTETCWQIFEPEFLRKSNVRITLLNLEKKDVKDPAIFTSVSGDGTNLS